MNYAMDGYDGGWVEFFVIESCTFSIQTGEQSLTIDKWAVRRRSQLNCRGFEGVLGRSI